MGISARTGNRRRSTGHGPRWLQPTVEVLECRIVPSWAGVPPETVPPPTNPYQFNLNNQGDATIGSSITSSEVDYFRINASSSGSYLIRINTPSSNLNPVLGLFDVTGLQLAYNDDVAAGNPDSSLTINLTAGVTYFAGVTNYTGTPSGAYLIAVDGPPLPDDIYEPNDSRTPRPPNWAPLRRSPPLAGWPCGTRTGSVSRPPEPAPAPIPFASISVTPRATSACNCTAATAACWRTRPAPATSSKSPSPAERLLLCRPGHRGAHARAAGDPAGGPPAPPVRRAGQLSTGPGDVG